MCIKSSESIGSIARKLSEVMAAVQRVPKDGHNKFHGYRYATESAVLDAVRSALAERHVALITDAEVILDEQRTTAKGAPERFVRVRLTARLVDGESGEWMEAGAVGDGTDATDKAVYKATTGAMKYFVMKTFMVSAGDDAEADGAAEQPAQRDRNFKPRPAQGNQRPPQGQQAQKPAATAPRPYSPADLAARGEAIAQAVEGIDETEDRRKAAVRYVADQCCRAGVWPDAAMAEAAIWKRLGQHHSSRDLAICWSALLAEHDQRQRTRAQGRDAA